MSDILRDAGLRTDNELRSERKHGLTMRTNLVVADSKVETCIDGIHAGGRYMSRIRGSALVRKALPNALQPFVRPNHQHASNPILTIPSM